MALGYLSHQARVPYLPSIVVLYICIPVACASADACNAACFNFHARNSPATLKEYRAFLFAAEAERAVWDIDASRKQAPTRRKSRARRENASKWIVASRATLHHRVDAHNAQTAGRFRQPRRDIYRGYRQFNFPTRGSSLRWH